jgi:hypothetical protein
MQDVEVPLAVVKDRAFVKGALGSQHVYIARWNWYLFMV